MMTHSIDLGRAMMRPVRQTQPSEDAPWRDNAWLAFWDQATGVSGVVHVSTSPNAGARHARLNIRYRGKWYETLETLEPGTFASEHIDFDLNDGIALATPEVTGHLKMEPLFAIADYTGGAAFPSVLTHRPLNHYQQAAKVTGHLTIDGETLAIDGHGYRDRTWGYRNESASILEYIATQCVFPRYSVSAIRFAVSDGSDRAEGYILDDEARPVRPFTQVVRGRAGDVQEFAFQHLDGKVFRIEIVERNGIFPLPVSPERNTGPTLAAYEEFCVVRASDGQMGYGVVGVGSRRQLC